MKKIMSVTIEEDLMSWLSAYSRSQSKFRNKSHLVEVALEKLKEQEESEVQTNSKNSQTHKNTKHRTTHAPTTSTTHRRNLL